MAEFFEHGKIDDQIANGDSGARFSSSRLKNAERKILNGKMRIRRNVNE
jgi:hypothetical protein